MSHSVRREDGGCLGMVLGSITTSPEQLLRRECDILALPLAFHG